MNLATVHIPPFIEIVNYRLLFTTRSHGFQELHTTDQTV